MAAAVASHLPGWLLRVDLDDYFDTDADGTIMDVCPEMLTWLGYTREELVGQFMGILMSPFLSHLHSTHLLPLYRQSTPDVRARRLAAVCSMTRSRPLIVYTKSQQPVYINLHVGVPDDFPGRLRVFVSPRQDADSHALYTSAMNPSHRDAKENFTESEAPLVIIAIDFVNATELLMTHGTSNMIDTHVRFHTELVKIIKRFVLVGFCSFVVYSLHWISSSAFANVLGRAFYPYIHIHELVGDSVILVANLEWRAHVHNVGSMVASFLTQLAAATSFVESRIGVAMSPMHVGYIDDRLRLFGPAINKAARLENVCSPGHAVVCETFFTALQTNPLTPPALLTGAMPVTYNLKGFGPTVGVVLPLHIAGSPVFTRIPNSSISRIAD